MSNVYGNFHKEIKLFDEKRDEKNLRLGLHFGFLKYLLEEEKDVLNELKRLVFVANKDFAYSETVKIASMVTEFLDKKPLDTSFFENNKNFYKNSYKSLKNQYYLFYLLFKVLADDKSSHKFEVELSKYALTDNLACLLQSFIYYSRADYSSMYDSLANAYIKGCKSPYFYFLLGEYFLKGDGVDKHKIFGAYVKWAINHKIDLKNVINIYYSKDSFYDFGDFKLLNRLYKVTQNIDVLRCLVSRAIDNEQIINSDIAYGIYIEAYRKQINTNSFDNLLLKAVASLGFKDISVQTMEKFLELANVDTEELSYLYKLITSYEKYDSLKKEYQKDIFNLTYKGLLLGKDDKTYLNLYKYILLEYNELIEKDKVSMLEDILIKNIFKYRLDFFGKDADKVRVLWLKNHHFEEGDIFFAKDNYAEVYAIDEEASLLFFDYGKKNILDVTYEFSPILEGENSKLYSYFYKKGIKSDFLVLSIALSALETKKYNLEIFEDVLKVKLSPKYQNIFKNILGIHYFNNNNLENSLKYFDEIEIVNKDLGKLLIKSQLANKEYNKVCRLLIKFKGDLEKDNLLETVDFLVQKDIKVDVSTLCYELLSDGHFTINTLKYLVENFKGSIGEYKVIYKYVKETDLKDTFTNKVLDSFINKNILSSAKKDINFFVLLLKDLDNESTIRSVCEYLTFEILVKNFAVTKELLSILENFYEKQDLKFLSIALSKVYLYNKTDKTKDIAQDAIKLCKEHNIIFPFLKGLPECEESDFVNNYFSAIYIVDKNEQLFIKINGDIKAMDTIGLGIYYYTSTCFFGETILYGVYNKDNELLEEKTYKNQSKHISFRNDLFGKINNALIYESNHKFDLLEKEIEWIINEEQESYLIF